MSVTPAKTYIDASSAATWVGLQSLFSDNIQHTIEIYFTKARLVVDKCLAVLDVSDRSYSAIEPFELSEFLDSTSPDVTYLKSRRKKLC